MSVHTIVIKQSDSVRDTGMQLDVELTILTHILTTASSCLTTTAPIETICRLNDAAESCGGIDSIYALTIAGSLTESTKALLCLPVHYRIKIKLGVMRHLVANDAIPAYIKYV